MATDDRNDIPEAGIIPGADEQAQNGPNNDDLDLTDAQTLEQTGMGSYNPADQQDSNTGATQDTTL